MYTYILYTHQKSIDTIYDIYIWYTAPYIQIDEAAVKKPPARRWIFK